MKRNQSQRIGEWGELEAARLLVEHNWVVHRCNPDYGVDFLGQPCTGDWVSGHLTLFQVKAAREGAEAPFMRFDANHVRLWKRMVLPLYIVLVYQDSPAAYIIDVKDTLIQLEKSGKDLDAQKSFRVMVDPRPMRLTTKRMAEIQQDVEERYDVLFRAVDSYLVADRRTVQKGLVEPVPTAPFSINRGEDWARELGEALYGPPAESEPRVDFKNLIFSETWSAARRMHLTRKRISAIEDVILSGLAAAALDSRNEQFGTVRGSVRQPFFGTFISHDS